MTLRLKGAKPKEGSPDRRAYLIDLQEAGRRIRLSSGTRNKDLALKRQQQVLEALQANPEVSQDDLRAIVRGIQKAARMNPRGQGMTLAEAFRRGLSDPECWGKVKRPDAIIVNRDILMRVLGADMPLKALTADVIRDLRDDLLAGKGHHPDRPCKPRDNATVNRKLGTLGALLHKALAWNPAPITSVPHIPKLKERGGRTFVYTIEQEEAILRTVLDLDNRAVLVQGGHPVKRNAHWYHKLYIVLAETGFRLSEALNLQWDDIDMTNRVVSLWRKGDLKTDSSVRQVPITDRCFKALKSPSCMDKHRAGPFDGMNKRRAQELWKTACKTAGIANKDAVLHALRHTAATRVLSLTGDIRLTQQWLGHSDLSTTMRYAKVVDNRMREAAKLLDGQHRDQKDTRTDARH